MRFNRTLAVMIVFFVIVGIAVIDGSSLLFAKWQLSDSGDLAISDAVDAYAGDARLEEVQATAQRALDSRQSGAKVVKVEVDTKKGELRLIIKKDANALFIDKISALEDWTHLTTVKVAPLPD